MFLGRAFHTCIWGSSSCLLGNCLKGECRMECTENVLKWLLSVICIATTPFASPPLCRIILPRLEQCRKCPIKLGEIFLNEEEDFLNYSHYFKNMPHQTKLMNEGGIEFFAVSLFHSYTCNPTPLVYIHLLTLHFLFLCHVYRVSRIDCRIASISAPISSSLFRGLQNINSS